MDIQCTLCNKNVQCKNEFVKLPKDNASTTVLVSSLDRLGPFQILFLDSWSNVDTNC